jgi:hypothetical protein
MYLEAVMECDWRCTWSLRSSELRDTLGGRDQASLERNFETRRWRELRDALGGSNCARLEMHLEAEIK